MFILFDLLAYLVNFNAFYGLSSRYESIDSFFIYFDIAGGCLPLITSCSSNPIKVYFM